MKFDANDCRVAAYRAPDQGITENPRGARVTHSPTNISIEYHRHDTLVANVEFATKLLALAVEMADNTGSVITSEYRDPVGGGLYRVGDQRELVYADGSPSGFTIRDEPWAVEKGGRPAINPDNDTDHPSEQPVSPDWPGSPESFRAMAALDRMRHPVEQSATDELAANYTKLQNNLRQIRAIAKAHGWTPDQLLKREQMCRKESPWSAGVVQTLQRSTPTPTLAQPIPWDETPHTDRLAPRYCVANAREELNQAWAQADPIDAIRFIVGAVDWLRRGLEQMTPSDESSS